MPRVRLVAVRVVAVVEAVFWGWFFFGLQDLLTVFTGGQDFAPHYLLESGWGLLFLLFVTVPLIGLAYRPRATALIAQLGAVGIAVVVGALLAGSAAHLVPGATLLITALVIVALVRPDLRPRRLRVDRLLAVWVLLAVVPSLVYAVRMARATVDAETTVGLDHYPIQAALGIAVIVVAGVITLAAHASGTWVATATLGVTVGWLGVESVVYPHRAASFGSLWGWLAVGWAATFLVVALRRGSVASGGNCSAVRSVAAPRCRPH